MTNIDCFDEISMLSLILKLEELKENVYNILNYGDKSKQIFETILK